VNITDIVRSLLDRGICQSEVKAMIEFPHLFLSSPTRDVQQTESENDATRSIAEALEDITSINEHLNEPDEEDGIPMVYSQPEEETGSFTSPSSHTRNNLIWNRERLRAGFLY
jgi:hypothetical protein